MFDRTMDSVPSYGIEPMITQNHRAAVEAYLGDTRLRPLLLLGDAQIILEQFPASSIDVVMTSPPYWGKRDYADGGIELSTITQALTARLPFALRLDDY